MKNNKNAGKGDSPRNCFSKQYKKNYDQIKWSKDKNKPTNNNQIVGPDTLEVIEDIIDGIGDVIDSIDDSDD